MKQLTFLIGAILFLSTNVQGQVDLEENKKYDLLSNYEIAAGKHLNSKTVAKLTTSGSRLSVFDLGIEQKIGKSFSIGLNLNLETPSIVGFIREGNAPNGFFGFGGGITAEGRYYPRQKELIDQGFGNNVNGLYLSSGLGVQNRNFNWGSFAPIGYLGVGVQSRFLKNGIVDFSFKAGLERDQIFLEPSMNLGFALSENYNNLALENARCNILNCFEERNYQLKVPLNGLFYLSNYFNPNFRYLGFSPKLKFEHRIFKGLSLNHSVRLGNSWIHNLANGGGANKIWSSYSYINNVRWYLLKKRNIASGKSADNLSGLYLESQLGINYNSNYNIDFPDFENNDLLFNLRRIDIGLNLGYQTRLFKSLYLDIRGFGSRGFNKFSFVSPNSPGLPNFKKYEFGVSMEIGLLF